MKNNKWSFLKQRFFWNKSVNKNNFIKFFYITLITIIVLLLLVSIGADATGFDYWWIINQYAFSKIIISGLCLGVSGYLIQHLSNNKVADTSILGVGNINAIILAIILLALDLSNNSDANSYNIFLPYCFIACSVLSTIIIYLISIKNQQKISNKFLIIGVLINFLFIAISTAISTYVPSGKAQILQRYIEGMLTDAYDPNITICYILVGILIGWLLTIINKFRILSVNQDIAQILGINKNWISFQILFIIGALSGVAYVLVGNIVFLGLVAGNIATHMFKKNMKFGIMSSWFSAIIILGTTFIIFNNFLLETFVMPINPALVISLITMPYFVYLVLKK